MCVYSTVCVSVYSSSNTAGLLSGLKQHGVPTCNAAAGRFISASSAHWIVLLRGSDYQIGLLWRGYWSPPPGLVFLSGGHEEYPVAGPSIKAASRCGCLCHCGGGVVCYLSTCPHRGQSKYLLLLRGGKLIVGPGLVSSLSVRFHYTPSVCPLLSVFSVSAPWFRRCPTPPSPQDLYRGDGFAH